MRPPCHHGRVGQQQRDHHRSGVLRQFAAHAQQGDLAGTVVATDGDLRIQPGGAATLPGYDDQDPHGVLLGRERRGLGGVGLVGLVGQDDEGHDHARCHRPHPVALGVDGAADLGAGRVLEADHGRLHVRPSASIIW